MLANQSDSEVTEEFLLPGTVVGDRYKIGEILAWGGMGIVYRAVHLELGSEVAVKMMRRELVDDDSAYERFVREARNAAKLKTKYVAKVFDFGRLPGGRPYLVMELLEGEAVSARLERGPLANEETANYLLQACVALDDAHSRGIVHRDLKPENLFLTKTDDGGRELKVLDFGIAKSLTPVGRSLTMVGEAVVGSPNYMSPEQMYSRPDLDQRADIWALGAVAYELLAGEPAFDGESVTEICAKVLTEAPRPLRALRADVWPELEAIVARCLERDPAQRFQHILEVSRALERALDIHDPERVRPPVSERLPAPEPVPVPEPQPEPAKKLILWPDTECMSAADANYDLSSELSEIRGLRPRRWPKRLAWVSPVAFLAAGVWVWWVGMDQLSMYARHRYAAEFSPSIAVPDDPIGREALIVHADFFVEAQSPREETIPLVLPIHSIMQKKIMPKKSTKARRTTEVVELAAVAALSPPIDTPRRRLPAEYRE